MAYMIVAPRDLFNDGNLLTCMGKLCIELDRNGLLSQWQHEEEGVVSSWNIDQDQDGNTWLTNIAVVNKSGEEISIFRPCNSRLKYPLLFLDRDGDTQWVFLDPDCADPRLSPSFLEAINGN